jgi:hypothetical protein
MMKHSLQKRLFRHGEWLVLIVLLLIHWMWISRPARAAKLASSNLMTNMIRLEALPQVKAPALFLAGSSIFGRLTPTYFKNETGPVWNLGLDGCGSMEALQSLLNKDLPPSTILLEVNSLRDEYIKSYKAVLKAQSPVRLALQPTVPFLQAKERPVELLYDYLHTRKNQAPTNPAKLIWNDAVAHPPSVPVPAEAVLKSDYVELARERLALALEKGHRLAFVLVPVSLSDGGWVDPQLALAQALAASANLPVFDLRQVGGLETLSWSDSVHLTEAGARAVSRFLETEILPRIK